MRGDEVVAYDTVIEFLNAVDPLVARLKLIGGLSLAVDDSSLLDKGDVAISLLEMVSEYAERLEAVLARFTLDIQHDQGGRG